MRNLTKTLVAVSLLTSTSVHSLGIGGIKLRSALNQKLNAEIALVTSAGENVGDIQVKLASPAKFDEAGVPWTYFLTKIKFTPVAKADGSVVVKLTSDEALKEPYLDFLLEVSGPNGSLFREFTVLVDPPVSYKQPVVQVISRSEREPDRYPDVSESVRPMAPSPQETSDLVEPDSGSSYGPVDEYGPIRKSDTIWSIANQVKTDDVSAAQMVMAIYEANPEAFSRPNVNTLLAGSMLTIPDREAVLKLSQSQAFSEFKQQGNIWRGGNKRISAVRKSAQPIATHKQKHAQLIEQQENLIAKPVETVKQLKLDPPLEGDIADSDAIASKASSGKDGTVAVSAGKTIKGNVNPEDADLKQRFERIEQQLLMMQKMLELKDAQLAALQNKQVPISADALPPPAESVISPSVTSALPVNPLEPATKSAHNTSALAIAEPEPMEVSKPVVKAAPAQSNLPIQTPSADPFTDYYLLASGIGASLLGALGLIWWSKRKVEQPIDTESMFASASQISLPDTEKEVSAPTNQTSGYEVGMVAESAFLSEFTPSEFDAFETDQTEIDPMSEADVYLAYGRYQQAEELIRQVILEHPSRNECKLKLLEIFHASENKPEFNQYVRQLINEGKQSETSFWAKVVEMADEFTPGSGALITLSEDAPTATTMVSKASEASTRSDVEFNAGKNALDFDFDALSVDDSISATVSEPSISFDKNQKTGNIKSAPLLNQDSDFASVASFGGADFSVTGDDQIVSDTLAQKDNNELDFDLNAFALENPSSEEEAIEFINDEDNNSLEFDLNAFALDDTLTTDEPVEFIAEERRNGLDFNLNVFDEEVTLDADQNANLIDEVMSAEDHIELDSNPNTAIESLKKSKSLADDNEGFDFDFVLEDDTPDTRAVDKDFVDLSFSDDNDESLKDFDFSTTGLNLATKSPKLNTTDDASDDFNFEFDFTPSVSDASNQKDQPFDTVAVDDLTDSYSAFETKVNLANAYVDMGDIDAAKDIAIDLLAGTAEQKKAGQEIIEKIS